MEHAIEEEAAGITTEEVSRYSGYSHIALLQHVEDFQRRKKSFSDEDMAIIRTYCCVPLSTRKKTETVLLDPKSVKSVWDLIGGMPEEEYPILAELVQKDDSSI